MQKIDPESFKGKVLLLVYDKIIIGAIIGITFLVYDNFKTKEINEQAIAIQKNQFKNDSLNAINQKAFESRMQSNQLGYEKSSQKDKEESDSINILNQRQYDELKSIEDKHYNESREEIQFGFKRAEYIKELVPIVVDEKEDILLRVHSLGALIDTKSIDANSAINFAQKLLLADTQQKIHYYNDVSGSNEDYLSNILLKTMPEGIPTLLTEWETRKNWGWNGSTHTMDTTYSKEFSAFWIRLFKKTINKFNDDSLSLINSKDFAIQNLLVIDKICPNFYDVDVKSWEYRNIDVIRIISSIYFLGQSNDIDSRNKALSNILEFINPVISDDKYIKLSDEVIKLLHKNAIVSDQIAMNIFKICSNNEDLKRFRKDPGDKISATEFRFYDAQEYLIWLNSFQSISQTIEPLAISKLEIFYDRIKNTDVNKLAYGTNYPIEQGLVHMLLNSNSAMGIPPNERATNFLNQLFSLQDEKLSKTGLNYLKADWEKINMNK